MNVIIRQFDQLDFIPVWGAMRAFTDRRNSVTEDEIWLLQHPPVFTLGQAGKKEHILDPGDIPVIQIDRGGQITYHGPGQLICYVLLDLRRLDLTIKKLVNLLEQSVIDLLNQYGIVSKRREKAPGIYIDQAKVAALGLRVRRGCTFHGLAINVNMDLGPFNGINPCGFSDMPVTQLADLGIHRSINDVARDLTDIICKHLGYNTDQIVWETSLPENIE